MCTYTRHIYFNTSTNSRKNLYFLFLKTWCTRVLQGWGVFEKTQQYLSAHWHLPAKLRPYLQFLRLCIIAPHLLNISHPEHLKLLAVGCITAVHLATQLDVHGWLWGLLLSSICYQLFYCKKREQMYRKSKPKYWLIFEFCLELPFCSHSSLTSSHLLPPPNFHQFLELIPIFSLLLISYWMKFLLQSLLAAMWCEKLWKFSVLQRKSTPFQFCSCACTARLFELVKFLLLIKCVNKRCFNAESSNINIFPFLTYHFYCYKL
jgi:hypothetical protein